ncbi:triple gene block protein 2 [Elderberry carlavirus A]|uniref:triple gene block protein 2 n=1 Tax=Elderberry carlavirus A TaxID=1569052 RepID=UPI00054A86F0|nr:triple gene block protein 2 [Elderberry carlavirus A]AIZ76615.1 triple gene block protein 2 [Elderberry carlavirus A]
MPLSAPPDKTKLYLYLGIVICVVGSLYFLTRNNLPHVGDNVHSLPHGGRYRDGTKSVDYYSPKRHNPSSNLLKSVGGNYWVAITIALLITAIHLSGRVNRCQCGNCPRMN